MALSISFNPVLKLHRHLNAVSCQELKQNLLIDLQKVVVCANENRGSIEGFSWKKKHSKKLSSNPEKLVSEYVKMQEFGTLL